MTNKIVIQSWTTLNLDNDTEVSTEEAIKKAEFYS